MLVGITYARRGARVVGGVPQIDKAQSGHGSGIEGAAQGYLNWMKLLNKVLKPLNATFKAEPDVAHALQA